MSADDMDVNTDGVSDDDMDSIGGAGPIGDVLDDMESGNLPPIQPPQNVPAASDLAPSVENDGKLLAMMNQIQTTKSSKSQNNIIILNVFTEFIMYLVLHDSVLYQS